MPSIKKSYIGSTLGSTNTPLGEVTPPDVPTPRAHYDETSVTYGNGTVSGRWDNIGSETDTIWHISDANNVNDPGQAVINGINAVVTESSRIRTPMNTTTIAQEWNVFFVIEPSADVTTGQGIADARSLRTGALQLYILNGEMIFAVEDGPGDLRLEARPEAQVVWMRCMGQAGDSTFQVTTAGDVRSVSGPLNDVVHAWIRIFNGLGSPVGQAHYPGKIGEIVLHETLTVNQGQAVVNRLANKWLAITPPVWSDVPDSYIHVDDLPTTVDMNQWVTGDNLTGWQLSGAPAGVTIDNAGIVSVAVIDPQRATMTCYVENVAGGDTSNLFTWLVADSATIDVQPQDLTVIEPQGGVFSITASHPDPEVELFYFWNHSFSDASGETTDTLTLGSTVAADNGLTTTCRVRAYVDQPEFEVTSIVVSLTANRVNPVIDTHPSDTTVTEPNGTTFSVEASHPAGAPLFPVWQAHDGGGAWGPAGDTLNTDPASETTFNLVITDTEFDQTGSNVRCAVRAYQANNDQRVDSNSAVLTVEQGEQAPIWSTVPDQSWDDTELPQSLDMDDYCTGATSYSNQGEGSLVGSILTLPYATPDGEYTMQVLANNAIGSELSNEWTSTVVGSPPVITNPPLDIELLAPRGGQNQTSAEHVIDGTPLYYRWQGYRPVQDDWTWLQNIMSDIGSATGVTLDINSTNQDDVDLSPITGRVLCKSYHEFDSPDEDESSPLVVESEYYTIVVHAEVDPVIDEHPEDVTVTEGDAATFTVVASHENPTVTLLYLWEASDDGSTWVDPSTLLSDVDEDSIDRPTLIINSTSLGSSDE